MRVLDLFCGAGGAAMGLHQAWPDAEIIGVDIKPQPRYPFTFVQADAMTFPLEGYDFIWASPPCQAFTSMNQMWNSRPHIDLLTPIRPRLTASGIPFVIENVPGAPLHSPVMLCGTMFDLFTLDGLAELRRHRLFESTYPIKSPSKCAHNGKIVIGVYGGHGRDRRRTVPVLKHAGHGEGQVRFSIQHRREAMGIGWMNGDELSQAIPPAYSRYIAEQFTLSRTSAPARPPA